MKRAVVDRLFINLLKWIPRMEEKNDQQHCKHTLITFNYWRFSIWIAENSLNRFIWKWAYIVPSKGFYRRANAQLSQLFDDNKKPAFSSRKYISMKLNFIRFFLDSCGVCGECERSFTQFYWAFSFDSINAVYVAYICFDIYTFSIENIQPSPTSYVVCSISATDIAVLKSNIICIFWVVITPSSYTFKGKQTTQIRLTTHQQNETNSTPPP